MRKQITIVQLVRLTILVMAMSTITGMAWSQDNSTSALQDPDQIRHQIREQIDAHQGMDAPQRNHMRNNLDNCLGHGMNGEEIQALFPLEGGHGSGNAELMLAMQDQVLALVDLDLPMDPMMTKIMEGRMKNVPADRLERVLTQTGNNIRYSHQMLMGAIEGGVQTPHSGSGMHDANNELAHCLWDGLSEDGMDQIRERAMNRAHDGTCTTDQFVAACQAATQFAHSGMNQDQAVHLAGEAMHNGYSATDMRTMGFMMMSGSGGDGHHGEMVANMQEWVHEGMNMDEMTHHMMEGGWMGPADMMGAGGQHGMDNMGGSGPGHDGGMHGGGDGGDDGHGGGDHGGGGM